MDSGTGWVVGAIGLLTAVVQLYRTRADNEGKRLEREAKHLLYMQDQVDRLRTLDDARALEIARLRRGVEECEQERGDEQRRSEVLARELAELKRDIAAGSARVTPLHLKKIEPKE